MLKIHLMDQPKMERGETMSKRLNVQNPANTNVAADELKQVANSDVCAEAEVQQKAVKVVATPEAEIITGPVSLPDPVNDNGNDGPNAPGGGALVPGLLREAMATLTIPSTPAEWKEFYPTFTAKVDAKKAILERAPLSGDAYVKCRHELMIEAAQLLLMEAYLAEFLRTVESHKGHSKEELAAMGLKAKEDVIKEFGLTTKQYRNIKKLTVEAVEAAIEFAFKRREIPNRSMAFNKAMLKRVKEKRPALHLDPIIAKEYHTLNLAKPMNMTVLFANISLGTRHLARHNIHVKVCSEKEPERVSWLKLLNPTAECFEGSFADPEVYKKVVDAHLRNHCQLVSISCPCQDSTTLNTSDTKGSREISRLFKPAVDFIKETKVPLFIIENVPAWLNSSPEAAQDILHGRTIWEYIQDELKDLYNLNAGYFSAADYGSCQDRIRGLVLGSLKDGPVWEFPKPLEYRIPLFKKIGDFRSLKSGEHDPVFKWHYDDGSLEDFEIEYLAHTPTGCSAWDNEPEYQPKNKDGSGSNGIITKNDTRNDWGLPAHTISSGSGSIHCPYTVHPGYQRTDGTWTDTRCFSIAELLRIMDLEDDFYIPYEPGENDRFIRKVLGEHFSPVHVEHLVSTMPVPKEYLVSDKQSKSKQKGKNEK